MLLVEYGVRHYRIRTPHRVRRWSAGLLALGWEGPLKIDTLGAGDDRLRLAVSGDLDPATADLLYDAVMAAAATPGVRTVEVDFADVGFCGSTGIGAIMWARHMALQQSVGVRVVEPRVSSATPWTWPAFSRFSPLPREEPTGAYGRCMTACGKCSRTEVRPGTESTSTTSASCRTSQSPRPPGAASLAPGR
ncbi:anti-anti-sigma factor [Actinoplanes cyaneus]|nr:anti-anti-sigma factor [Actinoplanes cyaneus]